MAVKYQDSTTVDAISKMGAHRPQLMQKGKEKKLGQIDNSKTKALDNLIATSPSGFTFRSAMNKGK